MPWTDLDKVRTHLVGPIGSARKIRNERVQIDPNVDCYLATLPITEGSIRVKMNNTIYPTCLSIELNSHWTVFASEQVIPDSVAVYDSVLMNTFYVEGVDYFVNYETGMIKLSPTSSISDGATVAIAFSSFTVYSLGSDYIVSYDNGNIKRATGSTIPEYATLFVDYEVSDFGAADSLMQLAIEEAEAKIVAKLAAGYTSSSTHALLTIGATELACAVAALSLASKPLGLSRDSAADDRAQQWRLLAEQFEAAAWKTLDRFLSKSTRHVGYSVKNG